MHTTHYLLWKITSLHQTAEGRGSKVETLPGGENLGQIDDLKYFNDKLLRGLRVPSFIL